LAVGALELPANHIGEGPKDAYRVVGSYLSEEYFNPVRAVAIPQRFLRVEVLGRLIRSEVEQSASLKDG
jgi:hypothetical protein